MNYTCESFHKEIFFPKVYTTGIIYRIKNVLPNMIKHDYVSN